MINYYDKLKKYFQSKDMKFQLDKLESIKNNQVELVKLYNKFKHNFTMKKSELKEIIKEEIQNILKEDKIPGGLVQGKTLRDIAEKHKFSMDIIKYNLEKGIKVEMEHTIDPKIAREIAMDHLWEDPRYYNKLATIEK